MKYIIFILLLVVSISSQAAPTCSKNGTTLIYTNGVTTNRYLAQDALKVIKKLNLNAQLDLKPEKVKYILAYNYEESISRDFLEAAVQRFPAGYLKSLGVTNSYAAYMGYLNGGLSSAIYSVALNSIADKIVEVQSNWLINHKSGSLYLKTIQEIKGHYETALNNGERVFAISHSQGGLFMSDAFDQVSFSDKRKFFSGFQIATPLDSEMTSHFGYATHNKDRLINTVRSTAGALSANIAAPLNVSNSYEGISDYAIDFFINHGIVTTYLNDSTIKAQVVSRLIATAQLLESNCPKAVINYVKNNLVANFDSTDPVDPNVSGLTYSWNFGDTQTVTTASKNLSHAYSQAGTYNVSLTVSDAYGASDTEEVVIVVTGGDLASVTICNTGLLDNVMNFQIDGITPFSLSHIFPASGNNLDPHTCECKTVQIPKNQSTNIYVVATSPKVSISPYSGQIYLSGNSSQPFSIAGEVINYQSLFRVYRGIFAADRCGIIINK